MPQLIRYLPILLPLLVTVSGCKDLKPMLEKVRPILEQKTGGSSKITTQQMVDAIKQALDQGVTDSVNLLGKDGGFNLSDLYHINIPDSLNKPARILNKLGQGKYVTEFENRLNTAAEQSVEQAIPVFTSAVKNMSISDALNIMQGADNAATEYFKGKTEASLRKRFLPVIRSTTDKTGLTSSYKSIGEKINRYAPTYSAKLVDIDEYVLTRAMDSLFDRISIEEKLIRQQPLKRTTQLMKTVFGHFAR